MWLFGTKVKKEDLLDSQNMWNVFVGKSDTAREVLVKQGGA